MMPRVSSATIRRRTGIGVLPPNTSQWTYEHHALDLREQLALPTDAVLDHGAAFALLPGTIVVPHGDLPAPREFIDHFRRDGIGNWSGLSISVGEGAECVIYNDAHPFTRVRATLMEEFFHIRFAHQRSLLRLYGAYDGIRTRSNQAEREAFHTGAAALVPFVSLKQMISEDQRTREEIGIRFDVSPDLVGFRAKVTKLYSKLR